MATKVLALCLLLLSGLLEVGLLVWDEFLLSDAASGGVIDNFWRLAKGISSSSYISEFCTPSFLMSEVSIRDESKQNYTRITNMVVSKNK